MCAFRDKGTEDMLQCGVNMIIKGPWRTNSWDHPAELTAVHKKECRPVETNLLGPSLWGWWSLVGPYVVMVCIYLLSEFYSALSAVCLVLGTTDGFASFPDFSHASGWCALLNEIPSFCMLPSMEVAYIWGSGFDVRACGKPLGSAVLTSCRQMSALQTEKSFLSFALGLRHCTWKPEKSHLTFISISLSVLCQTAQTVTPGGSLRACSSLTRHTDRIRDIFIFQWAKTTNFLFLTVLLLYIAIVFFTT